MVVAGSTFKCQRCLGDLKKKNEEELGTSNLEFDSFCHLEKYLEGKEWMDFRGQSYVLPIIQFSGSNFLRILNSGKLESSA